MFTILAWLSLAIVVAIAIYANSGLSTNAHAVDIGTWGVMVVRGDVLAYHNHRILCSGPCEILATPFALPSLTWAVLAYRREQRRKRIAAGRCVACGYDLRASKGRCPECGAASVEKEGRSGVIVPEPTTSSLDQ